MTDQTDPALAARLRRIHHAALLAAACWVVVSIAGTLWLSGRLVAGAVAESAKGAERDAQAVAGIVNRTFQELSVIPHVVSRSSELRAVVKRYNNREPAFSALPPEERRSVLTSDGDIVRLNAELTGVRDELKYDLVYVLDSNGIRILTSNWKRPVALLGVDLEDRDYFREAMTDKSGHMFAVGRTTKSPVMFFSAAMQDDGKAIGVVVVRLAADAIGSLLGGRHTALIVDAAGMVVASSRPELMLHHVGPLANARPDAEVLREVYGQASLRSLALAPPARRLHEAQWLLEWDPLESTCRHASLSIL